MNILRQDLAHAFRVLVKKPTFSLIAILTLALGIGANTTIFSLINGVLLRPLPYPHADRLVSLWTSYPASQDQPDIFSPPNYLDVAARSRTFESVGAYNTSTFTLAGDGIPESISGVVMTASMSRVLGVTPQLGRWFTPQEDDGNVPVVLLSDALWRNRFGADPQILGRSLLLSGRSYQVVGVLPPGVGFPVLSTSLYAPISFSPDLRTSRGAVEINVVARMRGGVQLATAVAELRTIAAALAQAYPAVNTGIHMGAEPLQDNLVGNFRGLLVVLWAAVAFMLAVACANVANLLLTQAVGRQREFAIRRSLGASNGRLVRQLLTESLVLALLGGAAGLAIATWAMPIMTTHLPKGFPQLRDVGLDSTVLLFTLLISLLNGLLFSLAPTFNSARRNLAAAVRDGGGRTGSSITHRRLGRALVACEVGVVMLLLIGAGLMLRSLARLNAVNPGFQSRGLIVWQLLLPSTRYSGAPARRVFFRNVVDQVRSVPGVRSAALVNPLPFGPVDITLDGGFRIAGRPDPAPGQFPQALFTRVSPGYFVTMQIPLERGREFTDQDTDQSPPVVIVSETLARRYFPGVDPIGQRILLGRQNPITLEIVGLVGDVKHNNLRNDIRPELYIPLARFTTGVAGLVVRGVDGTAGLLPDVQRRVWTLDNGLAANLCAPVETLLHASLAPARIASVLLAIFAGTTLVLGLIGIYGVFSYTVSQRTREIGIRMSLGAAPEDVLRMVLGEAVGLAVIGMAMGVTCAFVLSRYLSTLLFGVAPTDTVTYTVAAIGVIAAALLAACVPARRAIRVDPAMCLRAE